MSIDVALIYRNPNPANVFIPADWRSGNLLYLDTDGEFSLRLTKEIQKLTDINQITVEAAWDTSIPATVKNLALLGISVDVELIDNTYPDHDVDVRYGSAYLNQTSLRVMEYDREANRLEVQLLNATTHWTEALRDTYLDDLELGTFTYLETNLEANMLNNAKYLDGDPGYYMGHVYYGRYTGEANGKSIPGVGDFRPLVHALKVCQLAFCDAGWKFSSPLLETDTGRRIVTYINSKDFGSTEEDLARIKFKATTEGSTRFQHKGIGLDYLTTKLPGTSGVWTKIKFNIEIEDPGNVYDPATGVFSRSGVFDIEVRLAVDYLIDKASAFGSGSNVGFRLVHEYVDGTKVWADNYWETGFTKDPVTDYGMALEWIITGLLVKAGEKVYVEYVSVGPKVKVLNVHNGSTFFNRPIKTVIQSGDTLSIGPNLRHDSVMEYVKGLCHLFQFMVLTDWVSNTVYFLTPYDLTFFGDTITGYFTAGLQDVKARQINNTEHYTQLDRVAKNRLYAFKKSTDAKIKSLKWYEYEPYSRFVDKGFDRKDKEKNEVFENPYFEASFSADTGVDLNGAILEAPWMVDNMDGQISYDIEPRILIAAGIENLYYLSPDKSLRTIQYYLFNTSHKRSWVAHVYQKCNVATSASGTFPNHVLSIPARKITYGYHDDDLYELIHKKYDLYIRDNPTLAVKCVWNDEDYYAELFRNRARISSNNAHDGDIMCRIIKIDSHDCATGVTELTVVPDRHVLDECIGFDVPLSCKNYPYIKYSKVGTVYTFSLGGTIESPISAETWYYKAEGASGWSGGNVVTGPVKNTDVMVIITFSNGCPPITLRHKIKVQLDPSVTVTKVGNKVTAVENGTHDLTVSDTDILWSTDGVNWQLYEDGIDLNWLASTVKDIYFQAIVTYSSGEQRMSDITTASVAPVGGECPDPDVFAYPPSVIVSKTPQGYFAYRTGEYNGKIAFDNIQFREKDKGQEWVLYGFENLSLQKCWEFRRVLVWCQEGCLPYCSPVVTTDCGACTLSTTPAISPSSVVCTHEQKWENPVIPSSATWLVSIDNNAIHHTPSIRTWIEQNDGGVTEINERTVIWHRWNFRTEFIYSWNIGETVDTIQVSESVGFVLGAQHTLDVNVEYTSGDANDVLAAAVRGAVVAALGDLGFTEEQDFIIIVSVTGSTTKSLTVGFVARHNPTNTWLGINKGTDILATSTGNVSASGREFQLEATDQPILHNYSPYGTSFKVRFKVSPIDYFLDDSASNFNNMVPHTAAITTDTLSSGLTDTGTKVTLTGSNAGCPGTTLYQWLWGGVRKADNGAVISRTSSATAYIQSAREVILVTTCQSSGYCSQEKRIMLTPL